MESRFVYDIPTRVYFGPDQLKHLGAEVAALGKRALLVYGGGSIKSIGLYDSVLEQMSAAGVTLFELAGVQPNPRVSSVREGAAICKREGIEVILAVGGGSVLDCAKFIGAAAFHPGDAWEILEGKVDVRRCLPLVTVLTLSATGSEMDCGGVISNPDTNDKIGMMFPVMQPRVSFLDPTLTYTVSAYQTACGSVDILSHILEVYFNMTPDLYMLDLVMEGLMKTVVRFAPAAMRQPADYEARANLMWASSWAINGFIDGGKRQAWSCHPIEHELSAFYDITHGHGLAIVTPRWLRHCLSAATAPRYRRFAVEVFGVDPNLPDMEAALAGIEALERFLFAELGLEPSLGKLGIDGTHLATMAQKAARIGGTQHAFVPLAPADIQSILENCL